ncbi:NACHT domain-containing protein [Flavobacterium sp. 3-210]
MEIKLKCSDFTKTFNLKEAVKNIFDFNIGTVITEVIGISHSKEMKAFLLLFNTFKTTNTQLKKELGQEILDKSTGLSVISAEFEIAIKNYFEQEITITKDFFEDIIKYNPEYLKQSFRLFKQNLLELKIDVPENYEYNYYIIYRNNLQIEFQDNKEFYTELVDFFENPIYEQNINLDKLINSYRKIKSYYTTPLQPDIEECNESLKDLYIEPFFEIYKNNTDIRSEYLYDDFESPKIKTSIHDFLSNYFFKGIKHPDLKSNYNMLFLLGQPGQGKTSFCYKLIYEYLDSNLGLPNIPIYFVKIRELIAKDFIESTFNTINKHLVQDVNFEEDNCILILDGLDEAYMAGGLNDTDLKNLYDRLNKTTQQNTSLKIILTSRLNYLKVNDSCLDKSLVCRLSVLTDIQISTYATKFKEFYPKNKFLNKIQVILSDKKYIHIKELLQQAVLIYFIAIADINIEEKDSKSNIYDKIFDSLAKRSWDKQSGQLDYINPKVKDNYKLYTKYLRSYIRNIAFEIYQSPNLYITLDELSKLESTKLFIKRCFNEDLSKSREDIKEISKYLLISFYFQESNNNKTTDTAIEFFHNSLWEYLTAEYMWEENKKLLLKKELDDDDEYENISKDIYFDSLNRLVGQRELEYIIRNNLIDIIENEKEEIKKIIFNQSIKLFYKLSQNDFLLEYSIKNNKLSALQKATAIYDIFSVFIIFSNCIPNNIIETNYEINFFTFGLSKFGINRARNIRFLEGSDYLTQLAFKDINNLIFENFNNLNIIYQSEMTDIVFHECHFDGCIIEDNKFANVVFKECYFGNRNSFKNNTFISVKFIDVEIASQNLFDEISKSNQIDKIILKNHKLEETSGIDSHNNAFTKYFIRYIGN